jgi:hypothetical protein
VTESTDLASPDEPHERQAVANFKESPNPVAFEA